MDGLNVASPCGSTSQGTGVWNGAHALPMEEQRLGSLCTTFQVTEGLVSGGGLQVHGTRTTAAASATSCSCGSVNAVRKMSTEDQGGTAAELTETGFILADEFDAALCGPCSAVRSMLEHDEDASLPESRDLDMAGHLLASEGRRSDGGDTLDQFACVSESETTRRIAERLDAVSAECHEIRGVVHDMNDWCYEKFAQAAMEWHAEGVEIRDSLLRVVTEKSNEAERRHEVDFSSLRRSFEEQKLATSHRLHEITDMLEKLQTELHDFSKSVVERQSPQAALDGVEAKLMEVAHRNQVSLKTALADIESGLSASVHGWLLQERAMQKKQVGALARIMEVVRMELREELLGGISEGHCCRTRSGDCVPRDRSSGQSVGHRHCGHALSEISSIRFDEKIAGAFKQHAIDHVALQGSLAVKEAFLLDTIREVRRDEKVERERHQGAIAQKFDALREEILNEFRRLADSLEADEVDRMKRLARPCSESRDDFVERWHSDLGALRCHMDQEFARVSSEHKLLRALVKERRVSSVELPQRPQDIVAVVQKEIASRFKLMQAGIDVALAQSERKQVTNLELLRGLIADHRAASQNRVEQERTACLGILDILGEFDSQLRCAFRTPSVSSSLQTAITEMRARVQTWRLGGYTRSGQRDGAVSEDWSSRPVSLGIRVAA
eukprot:TRINITY_DN45010_c0_g1_i1.p1 TRINITY_DN45010_c0_g1~~TRINITY_DN45010_c0_g1_i1.p1  ORF type:complete len:681 (+),score=127.61 TRINITY_DN45010_c0_g1_i1:36-2045(+)